MKPQPKRFAAVKFVNREMFTVRFECIDEALPEISKYLSYLDDSKTTMHVGEVSGLYDLDEVVNYINNWKPADLSAFESALDGGPALPTG